MNRDTLIVGFKIKGNLRFLSHQETVRIFRRALARAGVKVWYSEGFNPHAKLSLPFPRSVGVESDEELACVWIPSCETKSLQMGREGANGQWEELAGRLAAEVKRRLGAELPCGCELVSVEIRKGRTKLYPVSVTYVFTLGGRISNEELKARARRLASSETLQVERQIDEKGRGRRVDVAPFIEAVNFDLRTMAVKCKVSAAGTIRVAEIMKLLEIDESLLSRPVKRTGIRWQEAIAYSKSG